MRPPGGAGGPVRTDVVLVGGGHAHVQVLTRYAMAAPPGVRLTLISREVDTPYSGMLPGHVAGLYRRDEIHIDLVRLAAGTGTRLIHATATGVDRAARRVLLDGRPPVAYDLLSLDVGINPDVSDIAGAEDHAIPVKPIGRFLDRLAELRAEARRPHGPRRVLVVGGGAAGVELVLALRTRLRADATASGRDPDAFSFALASSAALVPTLAAGARRRVEAALAAAGVAVHRDERVVAVGPQGVETASGRRIAADAVLVSTKARAPGWLAGTGLELTPDGSVAVGPTLQTLTDPAVFAAGDCAAMVATPREKAGVFAVRQGPVLADNLLAGARGAPLRPYRPQSRFLVLLSTADGRAIAARGRRPAFGGRWVWRWKDRIDRDFMAMFADVGRLPPVEPDASGQIPPDMRCGGCAAKLGPGPLGRALARLGGPAAGPAEDAAVVTTPDGRLEVETVDQIRAFVDDPWRFGWIAAVHALSDIHAMGGVPTRALALATLPPAGPAVAEEDLYQLLAGARAALDREGVALLGGHTAEGDRPALGFAVTGAVDPARLTRKSGGRPGDLLVLTKPLGTGIVFAAHMRAAAPAAAVADALARQSRSNAAAAAVLAGHGATAVTDVTGFGLAGHLLEMVAAADLAAEVDPERLPVLTGVRALARAGYVSSAVGQNREAESRIDGLDGLPAETLALLFDPQTSGGLLAALPPDRAEAAVAALREAGDDRAAIVGRLVGGGGRLGLVRLAGH